MRVSAPVRARILRGLAVALVLLSFAFLAHRVLDDWGRLGIERLSLSIAPLVAHLALLGLSFFLLISGWHLLLRAAGSSLNFRIAARSWLLGSIARYIPGKVASVTGRVVICVRHGDRGAPAAASLVIEQVLYALIGLVFLAAAAFRLAPGSVASVEARLVFVGALVVVALALQPAMIRHLGRIATRSTGRSPLTLNLGYGRLAAIGSVLLAGWSLHGFAGYALIRAVVPLGPEHAADIVLAFVGAWAAGFLAFLAPAGLGVREAALTLFLSPLLPSPIAVVVALMGRLSWVMVELVGIALVTLPRGGGSVTDDPLSNAGGDHGA